MVLTASMDRNFSTDACAHIDFSCSPRFIRDAGLGLGAFGSTTTSHATRKCEGARMVREEGCDGVAWTYFGEQSERKWAQ